LGAGAGFVAMRAADFFFGCGFFAAGFLAVEGLDFRFDFGLAAALGLAADLGFERAFEALARFFAAVRSEVRFFADIFNFDFVVTLFPSASVRSSTKIFKGTQQ
jgi:hypothetical protein